MGIMKKKASKPKAPKGLGSKSIEDRIKSQKAVIKAAPDGRMKRQAERSLQALEARKARLDKRVHRKPAKASKE